MNPLWPQQIIKAIVQHYTQYDAAPWLVFTQDELKVKSPVQLELRTDGPWFVQWPGNWWRAEVEANILIMLFDTQNIYTMSQYVGALATLAVQPIATEDFCLYPMYDRRRTVQINNYGQIDKDQNIEQSTVEVRYKSVLKGDS